MDEPRIFIETHHCNVPENNAVLLVDKMPGNMGILGIELGIRVPELFLVRLEKGVLLGIEKARLEKKIPQ